jgi:hypothetical protein
MSIVHGFLGHLFNSQIIFQDQPVVVAVGVNCKIPIHINLQRQIKRQIDHEYYNIALFVHIKYYFWINYER